MAAAGVFIAVALIVAAIMIAFVLQRFIQGQIDQRLDAQIVFLTSMLTADHHGNLSLAGDADGPPFDTRQQGWYWTISGPENVLRSRSLDGADLDPPDLSGRPPPPPPDPLSSEKLPSDSRPAPADGIGPFDQLLHFRIQSVNVEGLSVTIVTSAPRSAVQKPLKEAMLTLGASLGILATALVFAMLLQVKLGLRPLRHLRQAVAEIRSGQRERLPDGQPLEVQPLVDELNALLVQNATNLERARRHVSNLAHGLKTPLATLSLALPKASGDKDSLHSLVTVMERRIRHHLGRARSAATSGPVRARTVVASRARDLVLVLAKVNAEKPITIIDELPADLVVACEPQDVDEMLGNILENAFRWSHTKVAIGASIQGRDVLVVVEDDGPGLSPEQMLKAIQAGQRLDESAPGFGFGLSITRELAELYSGSVDLGKSALGGLRVSLRLPRGEPRVEVLDSGERPAPTRAD